MNRPLRVLLVEDSPNDTEMVLRELHRAGFEAEWHRVETEREYLERLKPDLDIILSDYDLPEFSGPRALELLNQSGLVIPFILLSGTIGEEVAVEAMRDGADDYLLKDRLVRLGPAVKQAISKCDMLLERKRTQETQAAILNALPAHIALVNREGVIVAVNESWRRFSIANGSPSQDCHLGWNYLSVCNSATGLHSDEAAQVATGLTGVLEGSLPHFTIEYPCHSCKEERWFRLLVTPLEENRQAGAVIMHLNITEQRRAKEALEKSAQEQRHLAEQLDIERLRLISAQRVAKVGSWETNLVTMSVVWSDETHRIFETDPATLQPTHMYFIERVHPDDRALVDKALFESINLQGAQECEHRILMPDGRIKFVLERWQIYDDKVGQPVSALGTCQDITERKKAEESLAQSQALLRMAGQAVRLGGWSLEVPDYQLSWSDETCMIHDLPPGATPTLEGAIDFYAPEYRDEVARHVKLCVEEGTPFDYELEILTAKQRRIWVRSLGEAVRDEKGQIRRIQGAFQDISQQKAAEEAARSAGARLLDTVESITDGFFTLDREWRFTYVNAESERLLSCHRSTLLGRTFWEAYPQVLGTIFEDEYRRAATEKCSVTFEEYYPPLDMWIEVKAYPSNEGLAVYFRDVSERYRALAALRASESKFRQLADSNVLGIFTWDAAGNISDANDAFLQMFGHTREELEAGQVQWRQMTPPEFMAADERALEEIAASGRCTPYEKELFHKDGHRVPLMLGAAALDGAKDRGICYVVDISQQKQAEAKVRASEASLVRAQSIARIGNWDWNIITNELYWSAQVFELYGLPPRELGCNYEMFLQVVHPEDRERTHRAVEDALAGIAPYNIDHRVLWPDGTVRVVHEQGEVTRDAQGQALKLTGTAQDITERKRAEDQIREQATLLDKARDAILVHDLDHQILYWNHSAGLLYGWTAEEVLGRKVSELIFRDLTAFEKAMEAVLSAGEWSGELQQITKAGGSILIEGRWTLMRDEAGRPRSILAINSDITEKKRLEQQFLRAQRMESIGTLAGGIAHDLNNMLTPIMMSIDLLRLTSHDQRSQAILSTIETSAKRGAEMVKQILYFSRGVEGQRIEIDLMQIVVDMQHLVQDTFPKNIVFQAELGTSLPVFLGDHTQIHQILLNLCVNARDAMPQGGTLTVTAKALEVDENYAGMTPGAKPGTYLNIKVIDTGTGMPKDMLDKIFDPFFTTKEVGKGTGLGLSTALAIVKSHGGFLNVSSELGKGTTFSLFLPTSEAVAGKAEHPQVNVYPHGEGQLILIVDDEAAVRHITQQTLETYGYRVLVAEDGSEAIALYSMHRAEVAAVVTDMMMPVMSGDVTIRVLLRMNPAVKIIAASGLVNDDSANRAASMGVKHFLLKPFTAQTILTTLNQVLNDCD